MRFRTEKGGFKPPFLFFAMKMPYSNFFLSAEHVETVEPDKILFDKGIHRAAILAPVKIFFVLYHGTAADEADAVVYARIRRKDEHRTAHDRFEVLKRVFVVGDHAGRTVAVIGAVPG